MLVCFAVNNVESFESIDAKVSTLERTHAHARPHTHTHEHGLPPTTHAVNTPPTPRSFTPALVRPLAHSLVLMHSCAHALMHSFIPMLIHSQWAKEIQRLLPNAAVYVVGCKSDTRYTPITHTKSNTVSNSNNNPLSSLASLLSPAANATVSPAPAPLIPAHQLPITFLQGQQQAKRMGAAGYVECSVWEKLGVREVFDEAVTTVMLRQLKVDERESEEDDFDFLEGRYEDMGARRGTGDAGKGAAAATSKSKTQTQQQQQQPQSRARSNSKDNSKNTPNNNSNAPREEEQLQDSLVQIVDSENERQQQQQQRMLPNINNNNSNAHKQPSVSTMLLRGGVEIEELLTDQYRTDTLKVREEKRRRGDKREKRRGESEERNRRQRGRREERGEKREGGQR